MTLNVLVATKHRKSTFSSTHRAECFLRPAVIKQHYLKLKLSLQITAASARLVSEASKALVDEWQPASGKNISVASCNSSQLVCAVGRDLFYLEIQAEKLHKVRYIPLDYIQVFGVSFFIYLQFCSIRIAL